MEAATYYPVRTESVHDARTYRPGEVLNASALPPRKIQALQSVRIIGREVLTAEQAKPILEQMAKRDAAEAAKAKAERAKQLESDSKGANAPKGR